MCRTLKVRINALAIVVLLAGCAGRTAVPIETTHAGDQQLSCGQLQAETLRNEQQAQALYEQHKKAGDANIAIGAVGAVLFWPALFALDTGTAEKDEARALEARNAHLRSLSQQQSCETTASNPRSALSPAVAAIPNAAPQSLARSAVAGKAVTKEDRVRSLQDMLDRKAITRPEFERKRNQILSEG